MELNYLRDNINEEAVRIFFGHVIVTEELMKAINGIELYGNEMFVVGFKNSLSFMIVYPKQLFIDSNQEVLIRMSPESRKVYIRFYPLKKLEQVLPLYSKYEKHNDIEELKKVALDIGWKIVEEDTEIYPYRDEAEIRGESSEFFE
jgi:hypothetical protein